MEFASAGFSALVLFHSVNTSILGNLVHFSVRSKPRFLCRESYGTSYLCELDLKPFANIHSYFGCEIALQAEQCLLKPLLACQLLGL
jgi:hypothetical protein